MTAIYGNEYLLGCVNHSVPYNIFMHKANYGNLHAIFHMKVAIKKQKHVDAEFQKNACWLEASLLVIS